MRDRDIITEVAGLDGWQRRLTGWQKYPHAPLTPTEQLPPYLTSRDAIVPVIAKVCNTKLKQRNFSNWLFGVLRLRPGENGWRGDRNCWFYFVTATPATLCEALLRATEKWKE
jgi:hypothetical protein